MDFVIDEGAFNMNGLAHARISDEWLGLVTLIMHLSNGGEATGIISGWGSFPCLGGDDVATVLSSSPLIDRDVRNLALGVLGKCPHWDDDASLVVDENVKVAGEPRKSFGIAFSALQAIAGIGVAVVTLGYTEHRGSLRVRPLDGREVDISFVSKTLDVLLFYRTLFELTNVPEREFFQLAGKAFPDLIFLNNLSFGSFDGSYLALRQEVVRHLSALNDGFRDAFQGENGNSARISARLGIDVSIEGETRGSPKLMKLRDVELEGTTLRCEWHSKIEPHRNRIHFHPGSAQTADRLVIGIFTRHLPTK